MIPEDLQNLTDEQIIELGRQANLEELRQNRNKRLEEISSSLRNDAKNEVIKLKRAKQAVERYK